MQEVQLYYRRYKRCSCTTGCTGDTAVNDCNTAKAANAIVPTFGTGKTVFKCMSPIDVLCRNESKCRRYSCTTGGAGGTVVAGFGTRTAVFMCMSPIDVSCRNDSKLRRISCTTGDTGVTAVLQQMQHTQLFLILVKGRRYSRV